LCKERGFKCGANEKVPGPKTLSKLKTGVKVNGPDQFVFAISRSPCTPVDEVLTDLDLKYLNYIGRISDGGWWAVEKGPFMFLDILESVVEHRPHTRVPIGGFSFSSKAFRYAVLGFSAAHSSYGKTSLDALKYLGKFHKYTAEAIETSSYLEIVKASYMAFLQEYVQRDQHQHSLQNMIVYFKGMWTAMGRLLSGINSSVLKPTRARFNSECIHSFILLGTSWFAEESALLAEMLAALQISLDILCPAPSLQNPLPTYSSSPLDECPALDCFNICLDCYLDSRTQPLSSRARELSSATHLLQRLLPQFMNLGPLPRRTRELLAIARDIQTPPPWCSTYMPLRFQLDVGHTFQSYCIGMASLVWHLLDPTPNVAIVVEVSYAIFLCRLLPAWPSDIWTWMDYKTGPLFWAGLILRRAIDEAGMKVEK
jgi:hypothetical protein